MNINRIYKDFFKYTSLNVLGTLGISFYILADTYFVAKGLGTNGIAALNIAIPVFNIIHGCGLMLGMGGATRFSILKGMNEKKTSNAIFTNTVILSALFAAFFVLCGALFSENITALLGADENIFSMTNTYIKVILLFSPAFMMNNIFICFVRNDKNPKLTTIAMLLGSLFNIIFDYILIFPCNMGILGAVLATGFSPVVSMLILSVHKSRKKNNFHFTKYKNALNHTFSTLSLGFPSLIAELSSGIVIIIFNMIIFRLSGNIGIAAYGVVTNISLVLTSVYNGIAQGAQPLVSKAYGRGESENINKLLKCSLYLTAVLSVIIYLSVYLGADFITTVFNSENNPTLQNIAVNGLKIYFTASIFVGFNLIISVFFTSEERPVPAQILSLVRGLLLIIPMVYLLSYTIGINGVWLSYPVTEAVTAILGILIYLHNKTI